MHLKGQNPKMSLLESTVSVIVGYGLTVLIQYTVYPLFGIHVPASQALFISVIIVLVAFVKNFVVRRLFNYLHVKGVGA